MLPSKGPMANNSDPSTPNPSPLLTASLLVLARGIVLVPRGAPNPERLAPFEQNYEEGQNDGGDQEIRDKHVGDADLLDPGCEGEDEGGAEGVPHDRHADQRVADDLFSVSAMEISGGRRRALTS